MKIHYAIIFPQERAAGAAPASGDYYGWQWAMGAEKTRLAPFCGTPGRER